MPVIEFEGKTTEEAIETACSHLHLPKDEIKFEIISTGTGGIFGLLTGKKARIRVRVEEKISSRPPKQRRSKKGERKPPTLLKARQTSPNLRLKNPVVKPKRKESRRNAGLGGRIKKALNQIGRKKNLVPRPIRLSDHPLYQGLMRNSMKAPKTMP